MSVLKSCLRTIVFALSLCGALTSHGQDVAAQKEKIEALLTHIETVFAAGDIDGAMQAFTNDAIIFGDDNPNIIGIDAIREAYNGMMTAFDVELSFDTREVAVFGDTAYEQGLFTLKLTDKASGEVASDTTSRHVHILKRQDDGAWKTWRMITNTEAPAE